MHLAYAAIFWQHGQGPGGEGWKTGVKKAVGEEELECDEVIVKVSKCEEPVSGVFSLSVLKSSRDDKEKGKCLTFQSAQVRHTLLYIRQRTDCNERGEITKTTFSKT